MPTTTPLNFELPKKISIEKFLNKLSKKVSLHISAQQYSIKTFYDSFDWRLYNADLIFELNQSQTLSTLTVKNRHSGECVARGEMQDVPEFAWQFTQPALKILLSPLLEMRALISLSTLPYQAYRVNILNKDEKTTVRLVIEEHELLPNRISLQSLKGYEKSCNSLSLLLQDTFELKEAGQSILKDALKFQGRKPKDYSSKTKIELDPEMRSDIAGKYIFSHLLMTVKANESGTIADTDSEFLHDFRVAVRKTRAGLSQLKYVFPSDTTAHYAEFFAWLGQITGHTRDMDVYLLNYDSYKDSLPLSIREDLAPLKTFLEEKQQQAQQELSEKLKSTHYLTALAEWEDFLKQTPAKKPTEVNALLPIKTLANQRIWKVYQRILKDGHAISDHSPAESLHDLRKTCKKLRYLMEFFQSLYPETEIKTLIKSLKIFQEVLGDFQDYEVQETTLKAFSEEMMAQNVPANTFLAMGVLVQNLDQRRINARKQFAQQFAKFIETENQTVFSNLFGHR